jgi:Flp pilus assembly protein TadB
MIWVAAFVGMGVFLIVALAATWAYWDIQNKRLRRERESASQSQVYAQLEERNAEEHEKTSARCAALEKSLQDVKNRLAAAEALSQRRPRSSVFGHGSAVKIG